MRAVSPRPGKTYDFPIYTNQPPGRQLTGGHAAASTPPLSPDQTRARIQVPPGFEVRLFAAEPEVVNPVAMTWDERGRLWVLELYEYPKGAAAGQAGRDRIKILEDVDADGVVDTVKVWADGLSLATGLALGQGGVYVGQAPHLLFLKDTNGDDRADTRDVVLTGFGLEDRHELLNGFAWGPDGWLYMTHGVFTHSNILPPRQPVGAISVKMDAAVARFHPGTKKFEVFADGTSNPWGVDWNERGEAFVEACVIHHLFHMAPGGQYNRQGGTWPNPYGYVRDLPSQGLPAIVDWRHHRAAHSGICVYQGHQYPPQWRGLILLGNIHQNSLNCDRLVPVGATYRAERETQLLGPNKGDWEVGAGNFLVSKDPWFRPVSVQTGPDGVLWVMDWADRYPCYQNAQADPEGVDREYGRIWRVVWVGDHPGQALPARPDPRMDLRKLSTAQCVELLQHPNSWHRRTAHRLLAERKDQSAAAPLDRLLYAGRKDRMARAPLSARLAALHALHAAGLLESKTLDACAAEPQPELRIWAARLTGERADADAPALARLLRLAQDKEDAVRAAAAVALRQVTSGSLTVNTPPPASVATDQLLPHYRELLAHPSTEGDFYYPHIVWMAMEPRVAQNPEPFLKLCAASPSSASAYAFYRIMRRVCDQGDSVVRNRQLDLALTALGAAASQTDLARAGLDGLIQAYQAKAALPSSDTTRVLQQLRANPALTERANRLATLWGDTSAARVLLAKINDPKASPDDRRKGVQAARDSKDEPARDALLQLLATESKNQELLADAVRALGTFAGDDIAYRMVEAWKNFSPATRRAAADVLVTRSKWSRALLAAVDRKVVLPMDVSATARRALAQSSDSTVVDQANRLLGRFRATGQDKLKLIAEKRKLILAGPTDAEAGHAVAQRVCLVCHKLYGEGADVGPDLTGVGRSTLDALLHNIIDPNEVVGNGYETTEVELNDGTTLSGRLVEETDTRVKLLASGPVEHTVAKSDIVRENGQLKIRKLEMSLMPEGLEAMPDADLRNMLIYLLNPPQDNRPWSPALRKELLGDENAGVTQKSAQAR